MECFFTVQTVKDKTLPIWIAGIGYDKYQQHRIRKNEFPYYQIALCERGIGKYIVDGKEYTIKKGMLFYFAANLPHEYYPMSDQWSVRWILFDGTSVDTLLNAIGFHSSNVLSIINAAEYTICYNQIWNLLTSHKLTGMVESSGVLYSYLTRMNSEKDNLDMIQTDKKDVLLDRTLQYIKNYVQMEFTLNEMADFLEVSPSYLCRVFKERYGTSPIAYAIQYKINKAKDYLINCQNKTIKEIANDVGFHDNSYFIAVFKKHENLTPKQFRIMYTR